MSSIVPSPIRHKICSNRSSAGVGSNAFWLCLVFPIAIRLCDRRSARSTIFCNLADLLDRPRKALCYQTATVTQLLRCPFPSGINGKVGEEMPQGTQFTLDKRVLML